MKKILLLITMWLAISNTNAQTNPVTGTYTEDVDSLFQHMNKSEITTGILYDRVFPL